MSQADFDQFCQRVMQDSGLQARLRANTVPAQFCSAAIEIAQAQGLHFAAGELTAAIQANRRAWFERFCVYVNSTPEPHAPSPAPYLAELVSDPSQLAGWVPIGVYWKEGQPQVNWCYRGETQFTDSFFDQTVGRLLHQPFNQMMRPSTPIKTLEAWASLSPGIAPSGFIFHMSRCGSTLVAQMLAALPQNVVISEAGPLDAMLRANLRTPGLTEAEQVAGVRAMVSALGQRNHPAQARLFIKFDCINMLHLPLLRRAFPEVPWIFIYRDPVEVLVSQFRQRGGLLLPWAVEPALLGWDAEKLQSLSLDEYGAALLGRICEAAVDHFEPGKGRLLEYKQLPAAMYSVVAGHFKVKFSPEEQERLRQTSRVHAKNPHFEFTSDSASKQKEATAEVRRLAERYLAASCARLESLRRGSSQADAPVSCME